MLGGKHFSAFLCHKKLFEVCNIFITFAMRKIILSKEFKDYLDTLKPDVSSKLDYAIELLTEIKVISQKLAKKLVNTEFYELRIKSDNEYRIIIYPLDNSNLIEAETIILLNGFIKKSTKDYKKQIAVARNILKDLNL